MRPFVYRKLAINYIINASVVNTFKDKYSRFLDRCFFYVLGTRETLMILPQDSARHVLSPLSTIYIAEILYIEI